MKFIISPSFALLLILQGEIINFIQVDSPKINSTIVSSPGIIIAPIQIGVYIYLLFNLFEVTFLYGFGTLLLFFCISFFVQKQYLKLIQDVLKEKDNRLKITSETLNSIKILKLYAWEGEFLNRVYIIKYNLFNYLSLDYSIPFKRNSCLQKTTYQ